MLNLLKLNFFFSRNGAKQLQEHAAFLRTQMTERRKQQNAAVVQQYEAIEKLLIESREELSALLSKSSFASLALK